MCINTHSLSWLAESSLPDPEKNMQAAAEHALCEKHRGRGIISCYYAMSLALFTLHGYHCTCKSLTDTYQCPSETIQKSVLGSHLHYWIEMVKHTLEQWDFMYDTYVIDKSYKSCKRKFCCQYPGVWVQASSTIFELVKKLCSTGYLLYNTPDRHCTREKHDKIRGRLEYLPHKPQHDWLNRHRFSQWRTTKSYIYCHIKLDRFKQMKKVIMKEEHIV